MKKTVRAFISTALFLCFVTSLSAQTAGTLTFTFTPVAKSPCYSASRNVLAVWIQSNTGTFVKTKLRYCCQGSTFDHLPTWSVNAGGTAGNCSAANVTDATTGATLSSFTAKTFTWDAKNVSGSANGTTVADGVYQVTIQATWDHGTSGTATSTYTFTKGPSPDHQVLTGNTNFSNILIDWMPSTTTGIEAYAGNSVFNVSPNPTTGIFNVTYENARNIRVTNTLGLVVFEENVDVLTAGSKNIDLGNYANGMYIISVSNDAGASYRRLILDK